MDEYGGKLSAEFIAVSSYKVKGHLPANQKLECCCFRVNYAIPPQSWARSLLSNMDAQDAMNAVAGNLFFIYFLAF